MEENADDHKDIAAVLKKNLDSMSNHSGEIVSREESDVVPSNGASKTCEQRVSFTQLFIQQSRAESQVIILCVICYIHHRFIVHCR